MDKKTILVVDDDPKIRTLLRNVFEEEGFGVVEAGSAEETLVALKAEEPHLVTLDIHLASDNGLEIAREIRAQSKVPIIMVTARSDVIDRVVGLEMGADDYITKPFHVREVTARVRSVLRRVDGMESDAAASEKMEFDGITVCPEHMEVLDRDGKNCGLTSGDFKLLMVFITHPKRVLSRDQLMDYVGGQEWNPLDRTIDNQVARLRKKIESTPNDPKLIKTVRGVGYIFASDVHHAGVSANNA